MGPGKSLPRMLREASGHSHVYPQVVLCSLDPVVPGTSTVTPHTHTPSLLHGYFKFKILSSGPLACMCESNYLISFCIRPTMPLCINVPGMGCLWRKAYTVQNICCLYQMQTFCIQSICSKPLDHLWMVSCLLWWRHKSVFGVFLDTIPTYCVQSNVLGTVVYLEIVYPVFIFWVTLHYF